VNTTKQRILVSAANLFAEKGFTETTIRELADSVGLKPASLYNHFPSKNAILEFMLEDYSKDNTDVFGNRNIHCILRENPSTDGVVTCLQLSFPSDRQEYYLKVLCVLLQEQLRNPVVRGYMREHFILRAERNVKSVIEALKELGVLRRDTDPDYWIKICSSLFYSFSLRMMLGIGDNAPDFNGMGMVKMLRHTFDLMFETCKAR
jgi:AcrR family transcriptional regulator